jgi:Zn-dependent protease with chaperone function
MNLSYGLRLVCLCFAVFYVAHTLLGLTLLLIREKVERRAEKLSARTAERLMFAFLLAPAAITFSVVLGLCVPSYLRFEPMAPGEHVNWLCMLAAILGAKAWGSGIFRGWRAVRKSARFARECAASGGEVQVSGERLPLFVVEGNLPLLLLGGLIRSRLIVSKGVLRDLPTEQLAAALRHERAHFLSHDNWKRMWLITSPRLFPFAGAFGTIESSWARYAEWAADDDAVGQDVRRATELAEALVGVARMGMASGPVLMASLTAEGRDLEARVDRLLRMRSTYAGEPASRMPLVSALGVIGVCVTAGLIVAPKLLFSIHVFLEHFLR